MCGRFIRYIRHKLHRLCCTCTSLNGSVGRPHHHHRASDYSEGDAGDEECNGTNSGDDVIDGDALECSKRHGRWSSQSAATTRTSATSDHSRAKKSNDEGEEWSDRQLSRGGKKLKDVRVKATGKKAGQPEREKSDASTNSQSSNGKRDARERRNNESSKKDAAKKSAGLTSRDRSRERKSNESDKTRKMGNKKSGSEAKASNMLAKKTTDKSSTTGRNKIATLPQSKDGKRMKLGVTSTVARKRPMAPAGQRSRMTPAGGRLVKRR